MAELKIVINDVKTGKTYAKVVPESDANNLYGLKIGQKVSGGFIGLNDYELELRGGSDDAGFPMRFDIEGSARKRPYVSHGPGVRGLKHGQKTRKTMMGNTINSSVHSVNLKITKYGSKSVEDSLGIKPKEASEDTKEKKLEKPGA
ncbi:MAG: S6e family ribosomal protein [Nanoarchaeota archaeon]